jgi:hypothetical protein
MAHLKIEDAANQTCPWSGKPVSADSLTLYQGRVVGFCNPGCRDTFDQAIEMFDPLVQAGRTKSVTKSDTC